MFLRVVSEKTTKFTPRKQSFTPVSRSCLVHSEREHRHQKGIFSESIRFRVRMTYRVRSKGIIRDIAAVWGLSSSPP